MDTNQNQTENTTPETTVPEQEQPAAEAATEAAEKAAKPKKAKKEEIAALTAERDALKAQLQADKDTYQRMLAEYANYKRRTEQEKLELGDFTRADVLTKLLPAVDNLERAVEAPDGPEYKKGVDMTIRQLQEALKSLGLEEIPAQGEPFNPEVHHAVMREDAEGADTETVTAVFQKGYRMGKRILRPAMVKVAN